MKKLATSSASTARMRPHGILRAAVLEFPLPVMIRDPVSGATVPSCALKLPVDVPMVES